MWSDILSRMFFQRILFLGIIALCTVVSGWSATYYVSSTGSDGAAGTSTTTAWQTISKVNGLDLNAGDQVLFEGGKTFSGNMTFDVNDAGTQASPIVISSYGIGPAIISGGTGNPITTTQSAWMNISNINVKGDGRGSGLTVVSRGFGIRVSRSQHIYIDHVESWGTRCGVHITGSTDIRMTYLNAHDNGYAGVYVGGPHLNTSEGRNYDIYIGYSKAINNPGDPLEGASDHSGHGFLILETTRATVEYSEAANNGWDQQNTNPWGPCGIWTEKSDTVLFQYCISHNNKSTTGDGCGFDLDGRTTNSTIQYCYSYENDGAGYFLCEYNSGTAVSHDNTVRYCVSVNDGKHSGQGGIQGYAPQNMANIKIYNNVVYNSSVGSGQCFYAGGMNVPIVYASNNILVNRGTGNLVGAWNGPIFQGNCYWNYDGQANVFNGGTWAAFITTQWNGTQEKIGNTVVGINADPKFANDPANYQKLTDPTRLGELLTTFKLQSSSPCINAGLNLSTQWGWSLTGVHDLYGNAIPSGSGYDMGIYEYQSGTTTAPKMSVKGNNVVIANGDVTPSLNDFSNFDSVNITNVTKDRIFKVFNATGTASLALTGVPKVALSGTNAADFSVTVQPNSPVAVGDSTTFTIRFDPSAAGVRTATVLITNNDNTANPYTFAISGVGKAATSIIRGLEGLHNKKYSVDIYSVNGSFKGIYSVDNAGYQKMISTMPEGIYVMKMYDGAREIVERVSVFKMR